MIHAVGAGASPWRPDSPCTTDLCVPGEPPGVGPLRRLRRYLAAVGVIAAGLPLVSLPRFAVPAALADRQDRTALWARAAARAIGVRLAVRVAPGGVGTSAGSPATAAEGVLVVANHISWLDVLALLAYRPGRIVAKREVLDYPVVGALAVRAGTISIDRDRLSTLPALVDTVTGALRAGDTVVVFPEATTWCGRVLGEFRPAFFQAAIDAGAAIRPVAIRYRLPTRSATLPALIGEDTLLSSLRRVVAARDLVAEAIVLPDIVPRPGLGRRELAEAARAAVAGALEPPPGDSPDDGSRDDGSRAATPAVGPARSVTATGSGPPTGGRADRARRAVRRPA